MTFVFSGHGILVTVWSRDWSFVTMTDGAAIHDPSLLNEAGCKAEVICCPYTSVTILLNCYSSPAGRYEQILSSHRIPCPSNRLLPANT